MVITPKASTSIFVKPLFGPNLNSTDLQRHVRGERRESAGEDVLAESDDGGARVGLELGQQVSHLERLLQVSALVHVDRLQRLATREYHGVVLVLGFALKTEKKCMRNSLYTYIYIYIFVCIYMYIYIYIYIYVCVCVCVCTYIHTHRG